MNHQRSPQALVVGEVTMDIENTGNQIPERILAVGIIATVAIALIYLLILSTPQNLPLCEKNINISEIEDSDADKIISVLDSGYYCIPTAYKNSRDNVAFCQTSILLEDGYMPLTCYNKFLIKNATGFYNCTEFQYSENSQILFNENITIVTQCEKFYNESYSNIIINGTQYNLDRYHTQLNETTGNYTDCNITYARFLNYTYRSGCNLWNKVA